MPRKSGGKSITQKLGKTVETKYRHSSLMVRQGKDGSPEAKCPSCEEYIPIRKFLAHNCPNAIVTRQWSKENDDEF